MTALILLSKFKETEIEIWRPITDVPGYDVSSLGRVRSYWRKSGSGKSGGLFPSGRRRGSWTYVIGTHPVLRTLGTDKDGYKSATLRMGGKSYLRRVHRLVLQAFVANCREKAVFVNHKNNIPSDNRLPNLEWCTKLENEEHSRQIGTWPSGVRSGNSKVSEDDVREIRRCAATGETKVSLGRRYGMSATGISYIVRKIHYRNVS